MGIKDDLKENIIYEPYTTLEEQNRAEEKIKKEIEEYILHELSKEEIEVIERNRDKLEVHEIRI